MATKLRIMAGALLFIVTVGCSDSSLSEIDAGASADWLMSSPESVGMDSRKLDAVYDYAFQEEMNTQGVVVIKDGYLIVEWYDKDSDKDAWATSWSVGKSFASAAVGLAWDDGLFASLDIPMTTFFPEWENTDKVDVSLRDVLTQSSGIQWNEAYNLESDEPSDVVNLVLQENPMDVIINRPLTDVAGSTFVYSSGNSMLLSRVVEHLTGKNPTRLAKERLFDPMGMTQLDWWEDGDGNTFTFCCVDTTSRNFAKFGQLYLQRGVWGGQQLLSEEWVHMTTQETADSNPGYGLQWWLNVKNDELRFDSLPATAYFALGHDTQLIGVFPDQNMVIVRNGVYRKPDKVAVADTGLFSGGLFSDGYGPTGSKPPKGDWDDDLFFKLVLDAIVP